MKKLFIIAILLLSINYVNADNMSIQDAINNTGIYINENGTEIDDETYSYLSTILTENQIKKIYPKSLETIMDMEGEIESYDSQEIKETIYYGDNGQPLIISINEDYDIPQTRSCTTSSTRACWETNMKIIELFVSNSQGYKKFFLRNTWKSMPNIKSFDVLGIRWTGGYSLYTYSGAQHTNNTSLDVIYQTGNSNFKLGTNAVGLSQNLVDAATTIDNELYVFGNCSSGGNVYASYQHAKNNTTLATSHLYTFSSSGMGGLFSFYGNAVGLYDNTTGVSLSYTC